MPAHPDIPPQLRTAPFRGSDAVRYGLLTRRQLDGTAWRHIWRDIYVHADIPDSPATRLRALGLIVPPGTVVSGASAAWLHGLELWRWGECLEVTARRDIPVAPRSGVSVRHAEILAEDVIVRDGIPVTTPARTAFDLARRSVRRGDLTENVVATDALTSPELGLVSLDRLTNYVELARFWRWRGVRQAKRVVALTEPLSGSPGESRTRMLLVRGGLPRPVAQYPLPTPGGRRAYALLDLAYPEARVAVEYDGECHADQREADAERHNRILAQGWEHYVYTKRSLRPDGPDIVAQIHRALRSAPLSRRSRESTPNTGE